MYMDDIKLFAKFFFKLETLIQTTRKYSQDIGMEFGIGKRVMLIMRSVKRQMVEGTELPNQEKIKMQGEKDSDKYLGIFKADIIKGKIFKRVSQKIEKTTQN